MAAGGSETMTKAVKREFFARGKGLFTAAGPQSRFILFLILLLIGYTFLLKIFQKLTGIVDLPVFLPIALLTLLAFIGIAGVLYSHKFVGPMVRIRRTLEQIAEGDCTVSLRLRDADDPMLKDLAQTIGKLCDRSRYCSRAVQDAVADLLHDIDALRLAVRAGAPQAELERLLAGMESRKAVLEQAVKSLRK